MQLIFFKVETLLNNAFKNLVWCTANILSSYYLTMQEPSFKRTYESMLEH